MEPNETPKEAVVREVREETGLHVKVNRPLFDEDLKGHRRLRDVEWSLRKGRSFNRWNDSRR